MSLFVSWFPMLLLIGVWVFFMRQMQGGGKGGAFSFGKSRARMTDEAQNVITFADVAGCDEAKEEVQEIVTVSICRVPLAQLLTDSGIGLVCSALG